MTVSYFDDPGGAALAAFADESTVAVLPVAATEPHGPHLPVSTDSDIAEGHLRALPDYVPSPLNVAVLPVQCIGHSIEHSAFPGVQTRDPASLVADWTAIGHAFFEAGGRRLVIVSSHGGNTPVVDLVVGRLRLDPGMLAVGTAWMRFGQPADLFTGAERALGIHGGDIETSLMLHYRPDLVTMAEAADFANALADWQDDWRHLSAFGAHRFGWMSHDFNPSGVVGNAAAATAEKGAKSAEHALTGFAELLSEVAAFDLSRLVPWRDPA